MDNLLERLRSALVERYTVERELGRGGMAVVYLARDQKHSRPVAIKVLKPELAAALGSERFLREIEIAAKLTHPNILTLHDSGTADGLLYYVMPFVEEESLRERLDREKQLPVEAAVAITSEVADALSYAHSHGVIHRDIKPENILFEAGHAVVADFGIARAVSEAGGETLTETGLAVGTAAYMSPEQASGERDLDARSDVYSLGCVLYEMLGGEPPYTGPSAQAILARKSLEAVPPLLHLRETVPPNLENAVVKALAKAPADRFSTAHEFAESLEAARAPERIGGLRAAHPLAVGALYACGSLLVLAAIYVLVLQLGLPYWVLSAAAALVVVFLPLALLTGYVERGRLLSATGADMPRHRALIRRLTWRRTTLTTLGGFAVLGILAAGYSAARTLGIGPIGSLMAKGVLPERPSLIVSDFENRTEDSLLGVTVTEMLRIDLAQSLVVRPLDNEAVVSALQRMERDPAQPLDVTLALEIAGREGVPAVVAGAVSPLGGGYVLTVRLIAGADGAELVGLRETASDEAALPEAIDRLSAGLRGRIGESLRSVRSSAPLERVTTQSLDALRMYTLGIRELERSGNSDRAIELWQRAVAIDSSFASAHRKLAAWYSNNGMWCEMVAASRKAFEYRGRLPEVERYLVEAAYYGNVEQNRSLEMAALESALERDPFEPTVLTILADLHLQAREWDRAEELARRAVEVGDYTIAYWNMIEAQTALGRDAEADDALLRLARARPESRYIPAVQFYLAAARRDYTTADSLMPQVSVDQPDEALRRRARLDVVRGKVADARRDYAEAIERTDRTVWRYRSRMTLAMIDMLGGSAAEAIGQLEGWLERWPLDSLPPANRPYLRLATVYAKANMPERAKELVEAFGAEVPEILQFRQSVMRHRAEGSIAFAERRFEDAVASHRRMYEEGKCAVCGLYELGRAYEMIGEADSAIAVYERAVHTRGVFRWYEEAFTLGPTYWSLAGLLEQSGDRDNAIEYYNRFIELWKGADPELQPQVQEARVRLARLVGEP